MVKLARKKYPNTNTECISQQTDKFGYKLIFKWKDNNFDKLGECPILLIIFKCTKYIIIQNLIGIERTLH